MSAFFGMDIGSTSVKLVQSDGSKIELVAIGGNRFGKSLPTMSNAEKLAFVEDLKVFLKDAGVKNHKVVASITESSVYSKVMKFPAMSTPELATAIKWELDQSVPFPPSEVESSWTVIERPDKLQGTDKTSVYVVAVPSAVSESYAQVLDLVGLEPLRLENEVPALNRSFGANMTDENPGIVVDMGASGTNILVTGREKIYGSFYIPVGGSALTKMISDSFNLPLDQAESYKRTYGMAKEQLEGKMFVVLKPLIDNMAGEMKKLMIAFKDEHPNATIRKVLLTGGGCYLSGLTAYLSEFFDGIEVSIGDPFAGLAVDQKYAPLGPVFSVANGLSF